MSRRILQLSEAFSLLKEADMIKFGEKGFRSVSPTYAYLNGEVENTFFGFYYEGGYSSEDYSFWEGDNQTVEMEGNVMTLKSSDGDIVKITLWKVTPIMVGL